MKRLSLLLLLFCSIALGQTQHDRITTKGIVLNSTSVYTNGSYHPGTEFLFDSFTNSDVSSIQAGSWTTDNITVGCKTPGSSTVFINNCIAIYQVNNAPLSGGTTDNALYIEAIANVTGAKSEAFNPIVGSLPGLSGGTTLIGTEIDVNVNNTADTGTGLLILGGFWGAQPTAGNFPAVHIGAPHAFQWTGGIIIDAGAVANTSPAFAMNSGVMVTNGATSASSLVGDIILSRTSRLDSAANSNAVAFPLISGTNDGSNNVFVDPGGQGTKFGGSIVTQLQFNSGFSLVQLHVANSGTGLKHVRAAVGCTTGASIGAACTSGSLSWPGTAFADTSYTIGCTLEAPTGQPHISSVTKSTGSFTITIAADTAVGATATADCSAMRD